MFFFFFNDTATTEIYTLSLHDALPIFPVVDATDVAELVKKDIELRVQHGEKEYGQRLHPFNGRDALIDAYQEVLDLAMYLRQAIYEAQHDKN